MTQNTAPSGLPSTPAVTPTTPICNNTQASLTATCSDNLKWYDASGANLQFSGSPFVTPNLLENTTYKVRCENATTACVSDFAEVVVTVKPANKTVYVNKSNTSGTYDGNSWATAFSNLQDALAASCAGYQIWVAAGTYKPDQGAGYTLGNRNHSFSMKNGVSILGGFPNDGSGTLANRNWVTNVTILSGEIGAAGNIDNSIHVVTSNAVNNTTILDGFTVRDGNASGNLGGGMFNNNGAAPIVRNCIFTGNTGGSGDGGAVYNNFSSPVISNCTFTENTAYSGAGIFNFASSTSIQNCIFSGNNASLGGGGVYNDQGGHITITNCLFANNTGGGGSFGGGLYNAGNTTVTVTNCTFYENTAGSFGALFSSNAPATLKNCIIWGNSSGIGTTANITATNSIIQGGFTGAGNLNANPIFVDANGGNFRLQACSPAVNAGDPATTSATVGNVDLAGNPRFFNSGTVDIGAYEYQGTAVAQPTASASTTTPNVCVGNTINLSASGGSNFSWTGPSGSNFSSTEQTPSLSSTSTAFGGIYTVSVSNANCPLTATATVSVQVNTLPSISVTPPNAQCGGTIDLSTAFPTNGTLTFFTDSGFSSSAANPVSSSGTYYAKASLGSCTNSASVIVTINPLPSISVTTPAAQCGGTINLNTVFSSNASLSYFTDSGFSSAAANPVSSGGPYYATAINATTSCSVTASVSLTINTSATISVTPPPAQCGGTINLSAAFPTNGTLTFFTNSGFSSSASNPVSTSGTYYAKASVGTCTNSASVSITIHPLPVVSINPPTATLCTGQSLTLSTNAGGSGYSWTSSGGTFTSTTNQAKFSSNVAGGFSISVTVANSFNCTSSASATLTVLTQPTVSISPASTQNLCQGQPLNLTASGSAPFTWSGPSNFSSANAIVSVNTSSSSFSGVYKVTVGSLCTATATISVSIQQASLSISPNPLNVCLGQTINLSANASPNASAFSWKGPGNFSSTTQNISTYATTTANLGIYSVSASIGSCVVTSTAEVKSGAVLQAGVVGIPCVGGTIQFTATGMTSYTWSRPANNFNSNLPNPVIPSSTMNDAGIYFLSARSGSCFVSMLVPVMIVGTGVNPAFSVSPSSFAAGTTVSLSAASATGTYAWSGPNSFSGNTRTKSISNFQAINNGVYRLTLTSGTCSGYTEKIISINSATRLATAEIEPVEMEINAYPNPVTHTLTVEVRLKEPSALQLNLINSIGKDSGTWQLQEVTTFHKTELNLADLQGGVYLLQAQAGKQKVVKRVVKIQY
ncbi:MAG: T9SS type A sorting domain-containing protein [Spirosomataceae bacterium]